MSQPNHQSVREQLEILLHDASNEIDQVFVQTVFRPLTDGRSKKWSDEVWGITSEGAIKARHLIRNQLSISLLTLLDQISAERTIAALGEYEDLNAPLNREIDGNPESDTSPDLYIVRRATRNLFRDKVRAALRQPTAEDGR